MTAVPTPAERRLYGDLADDVVYLRKICGLVVAPFKGDFRVGTNADLDVVTASGLRMRARQERERRGGKGAARALPTRAPAAKPSAAEPPPQAAKSAPWASDVDECKCGRPSNHKGPCWARRGWSGPTNQRAAALIAPIAESPAPTVEQRLTALEMAVADLRRNAWGREGR